MVNEILKFCNSYKPFLTEYKKVVDIKKLAFPLIFTANLREKITTMKVIYLETHRNPTSVLDLLLQVSYQ